MASENTRLSKNGNFKIKKGETLYFSGIGGVSMSSLAKLAKSLGFSVCGYDREKSEVTDELVALKINVRNTLSCDIMGADVMIYSNAIDKSSPDFVFAENNGKIIMSRADFMAYLLRFFEKNICICGMHGKSTVSAMIYGIIKEGGNEPTALIGAGFDGHDGGVIGGKEYAVAEACEYMRSFLCLSPCVAVFLNIELEHTDCYTSLTEVLIAFTEFFNSSKIAIINKDDENIAKCITEKEKTSSFSLKNPSADYYLTGYEKDKKTGVGYVLYVKENESINRVRVGVFGLHNIKNAMAAIATARTLGFDYSVIDRALCAFKGVNRRLELKYDFDGHPVYEDYAHHPSEIEASHLALTEKYNDVLCVFQPHTYSRTYSFLYEMALALSLAKKVVLVDIYPAREENIYNISSKDVADRINGAIYAKDISEVKNTVMREYKKYGATVIMGAGDIHRIFELLQKDLTEKKGYDIIK